VKHPLTDALGQELERFAARFGCERCVHADEEASFRCSLEYPNDEHLERNLGERKVVVFCKEFELA